ncbi:MAG: hypothetical protein ACTHLZ_02320 [Tepidisphaeraceae bacterium]
MFDLINDCESSGVADCGKLASAMPSAEPLLAPANVFIGSYLRLELLARHGRHDQLLEELRALFLPMLAHGPGTAWEHHGPEDSRCHGFVSRAALWLLRDVLGIGPPGAQARTIESTPNPAGLAWARGSTIVAGQPVSVECSSTAERFSFNATVASAYTGVQRLPPTRRSLHQRDEPVGFTGNLRLELTL